MQLINYLLLPWLWREEHFKGCGKTSYLNFAVKSALVAWDAVHDAAYVEESVLNLSHKLELLLLRESALHREVSVDALIRTGLEGYIALWLDYAKHRSDKLWNLHVPSLIKASGVGMS